jgi:hypothetical protein
LKGFNREGSSERVQTEVNCCVKKQGLCTSYAPIYRRALLSSETIQTNQASKPSKPRKQTKQANQASSTSSTLSSTGPDERTTKEPNKSKQASTSKTIGNQTITKRKPNVYQTKTKRKASSNQNQTGKHPSSRTFHAPITDQYHKENRPMYGNTGAGLPIGDQGRVGRGQGDGVGLRGSRPGRVMVYDALPIGKHPPKHEQNGDHGGRGDHGDHP